MVFMNQLIYFESGAFYDLKNVNMPQNLKRIGEQVTQYFQERKHYFSIPTKLSKFEKTEKDYNNLFILREYYI